MVILGMTRRRGAWFDAAGLVAEVYVPHHQQDRICSRPSIYRLERRGLIAGRWVEKSMQAVQAAAGLDYA
jgi:hypothetical protein